MNRQRRMPGRMKGSYEKTNKTNLASLDGYLIAERLQRHGACS